MNHLRIAGAVATLALAIPAFGQSMSGSAELDASVKTTAPRPLQGARQELRQDKQNLGQNIKAVRSDFKQTATSTRQALQGQIKENREQFRTDAKNLRASSTGTSTRETIRAEFKNMKEENKNLRASTTAEMQAKREEMRSAIKDQILKWKEGKKVKLDALKKGEIKKHLLDAFKKLASAINQLKEFDKKIATKIEEKKSKGVDVSAAMAALAEARTSLADAEIKVSATQSGLNDAVTGATTLSKESVTKTLESAHQAIKAAREKYAAVLKALGIQIVVTEKASAGTSTTTATTTTQATVSSEDDK